MQHFSAKIFTIPDPPTFSGRRSYVTCAFNSASIAIGKQVRAIRKVPSVDGVTRGARMRWPGVRKKYILMCGA